MDNIFDGLSSNNMFVRWLFAVMVADFFIFLLFSACNIQFDLLWCTIGATIGFFITEYFQSRKGLK